MHILFDKPLPKLLRRNREHQPGRSSVVERNAHLVKLPGIAQLVLPTEAEAGKAVECTDCRFADVGTALNFL
jgi:hypothetical protein